MLVFFNSVNPYNVSAFLISTLLLFAYFLKKRIRSTENKIYDVMVAFSFLGTIISFFTYSVVANYQLFSPVLLLIPRFHLVYLIVWGTAFSLYVVNISIDSENIRLWKKLKYLFITISTICIILVFILKMDFVSENAKVYTSGSSVYLTYLLAVLYAFIVLIFVIKNLKKIIDKRYTPILTFILLLSAVMFLQYRNPEILIITFIISFNTLLMYFTIENPDVVILEEYSKIKEQSSMLNEEKELFILDVSREIKEPLTKIIKISDESSKVKDLDILTNNNANILLIAKSTIDIVDNSLDISNIDKHNFKITKEIYDPNKLFNELRVSYRTIIPNKSKNISFKFEFDKTIPFLYGDVYKLKNILKIVLDNSLKFTNEGYIELKVDAVIKNKVCRLFISIIDSGVGIDSSKINDILNKDRLYKFGKFDDKAENLAFCKASLKTMGGTIIIKSLEECGTEVKIILDQIIVENKNKKLERIDYNINKYIDKCKISLITNDMKLNDKLKKMLSKDKYIIDDSKDIFVNLKRKEKYDLIIVDEVGDIYDGLQMLKKLKKLNNFDVPIMLIKRSINFAIDEEYIKLGFDALIDPSNLNNIEEIINKLSR